MIRMPHCLDARLPLRCSALLAVPFLAFLSGCSRDLSGLHGDDAIGGNTATGGRTGATTDGSVVGGASETGGAGEIGGAEGTGGDTQGASGSGGTTDIGSITGGANPGGATALGGAVTSGGNQSSVGGGATGGVTGVGGTSVVSTSLGGTSAVGTDSSNAGTGALGGVAASTGGDSSVASSGGAGATGGSAALGGTGGIDASGGAATELGGAVATGGTSATGGSSASPIAEVSNVDLTFSGQPTQMALLTVGSQQFVGYWGQDMHMTVASRTLGTNTWSKISLAPTIAWDGHHSIVLAADKNNYLHLSGRMHNDPLTYLRTTSPLDVSTFALQLSMVGNNESSCTYPQFFTGPDGSLIFSYRSGSSGSGDNIFNIYNATSRSWSRLLGTKLIDGQSANSAYIEGPVQGPDGYWHLVWTWRVSADAATNHDLSYARSKDLINWESGTGKALPLPITLATSDIVDPVPVGGGMINNNTRVGFDSQNRAVVSYHKYDPSGATQLFLARVEDGKWVTHQATSWSYRWTFGGIGTLTFVVQIDEGVKVSPSGKLQQTYYHSQYGGWGGLVLDEATLTATQVIPPPLPYPASLNQVQSTTAGMQPRWGSDSGAGPDPDIYYMIRWETLEPNGDQPRNPVPNATQLQVYGFRHSVMDPLQ